MHNKGYLYRDMKPENWMMGTVIYKIIYFKYFIKYELIYIYKYKLGKK